MLRLERRSAPSTAMRVATPLVAVAASIVAGGLLFAALGHDPERALYGFFIAPLLSTYGLAELAVKATPLTLIALGLAMGFRAGVWNIGAEGQLTMGALAGGGLAAMVFYDAQGLWLLPLMCLAGVVAGMAYAAIPAFLRTRFGVNEILVSLMLTYVALLALSALVHGPWRDPGAFNFPESRFFSDSGNLPILIERTRLHLGYPLALLAVLVAWLVLARTVIGFQLEVTGLAPKAASFAGFKPDRTVWLAFLVSGGLAGLAGLIEVAGPGGGQLVPTISPGYGFTAIIVAFLGRLHPVGILLAAHVVALSYLGGENLQITMRMPVAVTGVFQGFLLFFLLAADVLVRYRPVWKRATA
ncbi:MAG: ABC transporter permease [Geminicoccaceae bacterium]|nr:MAG: ABC transporter permease [Geminicoccaceae bacterium]